MWNFTYGNLIVFKVYLIDDICIEVRFNHGKAIAWNLIKPTLARELNHVEKVIQTKICVIIATQYLKTAAEFDSVVGTYEKYIQSLQPLRSMLAVPTLIVGLEPLYLFTLNIKILDLMLVKNLLKKLYIIIF